MINNNYNMRNLIKKNGRVIDHRWAALLALDVCRPPGQMRPRRPAFGPKALCSTCSSKPAGALPSVAYS